jgi:hypothetical protein
MRLTSLHSLKSSARNATMRLLEIRSRRPGRIPFSRMRAGPGHY